MADQPFAHAEDGQAVDLDPGHLAVIGATGSGVTTTLRAVADRWQARGYHVEHLGHRLSPAEFERATSTELLAKLFIVDGIESLLAHSKGTGAPVRRWLAATLDNGRAHRAVIAIGAHGLSPVDLGMNIRDRITTRILLAPISAPRWITSGGHGLPVPLIERGHAALATGDRPARRIRITMPQ